MDVATAKTLVSALTVLAVVAFSLICFEQAVRAVVGDLRAGWDRRDAAAEREAAHRPSA